MEKAPRIESLVMQLFAGRNAGWALGAVGLVGCIPILNLAIFGYATENIRKFAKTGQVDFQVPQNPSLLVRESLIVGAAALVFAGGPWLLARLLGSVIDSVTGYMFFPVEALLSSLAGVIGLGLFGAAFTTYLRMGKWEALLQFRPIAELARSMASALWLPSVLIFGLAAIAFPFWWFGLAIGLFIYCFYIGEITRRLAQA